MHISQHSLAETLSETQTNILQATIDRIIPADDFPGGWEAGCGTYLAQHLSLEQQTALFYRQGLDALDAEARAVFGLGFVALGPDAQDMLLTSLDLGTVEGVWPLDPTAFFRRLVTQTMEGFYADPGNGGNRDGIAWKMIGFGVTA